MSTDDLLKKKINGLPSLPGVYKFYDVNEALIYVGKAKNLKKRVSSYFQTSKQHDKKTRRLISQIKDLEYTVVNSEFDSLLLENALIKENQPKYNIMLRDDKTYPYILITREDFPRIFATRTKDKKRGEYFGPYSSVGAMKTVLEYLQKLYNIRTCNLPMNKQNVKEDKFRVCLEYHIGNCLGPCENLQSQEDYIANIQQARNILKGEINKARRFIKEQMQEFAENYAYEKAEVQKKKLDLLEKFQSKSVITSPKLNDIDVITAVHDEKKVYVNYLKVQEGTIIASKNFTVNKKLDETTGEVLQYSILSLRKETESQSSEILSNEVFEYPVDQVMVTVPKIGDKRKLTDLSLKNALQYKKEKTLHKSKETSEQRILETLKRDLKLKELPKHIECFDNSNIQGNIPVASMVCFKMAKPSKKDYRHYNIKTVEGPNDFDSMYEIVYRRYKRLYEEERPFPQLVIIDGGKGQLSAATEALKALNLYHRIPVIGIAKKLEEIYYPEDSTPLYLNKTSESLKLIQQLRNEAHRFAITFHRNKRSHQFIENKLERVKGIGTETAKKLLTHFKSVEKLKRADRKEIEDIVGKAKTNLLEEAIKKGEL